MDVVSGIVVAVTLWWVILFITLPFGVKRHGARSRGIDAGAPQRPQIGKKLLITTAATLALWLLLDLLVRKTGFSLHSIGKF